MGKKAHSSPGGREVVHNFAVLFIRWVVLPSPWLGKVVVIMPGHLQGLRHTAAEEIMLQKAFNSHRPSANSRKAWIPRCSVPFEHHKLFDVDGHHVFQHSSVAPAEFLVVVTIV